MSNGNYHFCLQNLETKGKCLRHFCQLRNCKEDSSWGRLYVFYKIYIQLKNSTHPNQRQRIWISEFVTWPIGGTTENKKLLCFPVECTFPVECSYFESNKKIYKNIKTMFFFLLLTSIITGLGFRMLWSKSSKQLQVLNVPEQIF